MSSALTETPEEKPGEPDEEEEPSVGCCQATGLFMIGLFKFLGYLIYGTVLFITLLPLVIIMWIPWSCGTCIPSIKRRSGEEMIKKYSKNDGHGPPRHTLDLWGRGIERYAANGSMYWAFWKGRTWELYGLIRDLWRTVSRQGLQIGSVIVGVFLIIFHVEIMAHDYDNKSVSAFVDGYYGGTLDNDPSSALTEGDAKCAYVVGTGIANWSDNLENLVWFGMYHGFLILLCIMLIVDETLNVRFGLFAPQWTRAGIGYTIMFLVAATLATSPNWGAHEFARLVYVILVAFFFLGCYNVARGAIVGLGLTEGGYAERTNRCRRHPLRPWSEHEWSLAKKRQDFRERRTDGKATDDEALYWTEKMQLILGDHCWQKIKISPRDWMYGPDGRAQRIYKPTKKEIENARGRVSRRFIHGFPMKMPRPTPEDHRKCARFIWEKHFLPFFGNHNWSLADRWKDVNDPKQRAIDDNTRKGLHWVLYCLWWIDVRRIYACCCAIAAFVIHVGLMCDAFARPQFASLRSQYQSAHDTWKDNLGPRAEDCQYFDQTHMALWVQTGSTLQGVFANMFWLGLWHVFMLGFCLGVLLVGVSNNRVFGMHLPVPITLVGPRLSSISMGWTMCLIAVGILQLGLFPSQPPIVRTIAKGVGYSCLVCWVLYLVPNEPLGMIFGRGPFWSGLNREAFMFMEEKKFHEQMYDYTQ